MIQTFKNKETEQIFLGNAPIKISHEIARRAELKLLVLNRSETLSDLRIPPSNRLESLKGDKKGQYSIRVNDRYRICFCWDNGNAYDVEFVDYH